MEFPLPAGVLEDNLVAIAVLVGAEGFAGTGADRVLVIPFFLGIPGFQLITIPAFGIEDLLLECFVGLVLDLEIAGDAVEFLEIGVVLHCGVLLV